MNFKLLKLRFVGSLITNLKEKRNLDSMTAVIIPKNMVYILSSLNSFLTVNSWTETRKTYTSIKDVNKKMDANIENRKPKTTLRFQIIVCKIFLPPNRSGGKLHFEFDLICLICGFVCRNWCRKERRPITLIRRCNWRSPCF